MPFVGISVDGRPASHARRDGKRARGRTSIAVLDAERVDDGPLATAWLPCTLPLGFHGHIQAHLIVRRPT